MLTSGSVNKTTTEAYTGFGAKHVDDRDKGNDPQIKQNSEEHENIENYWEGQVNESDASKKSMSLKGAPILMSSCLFVPGLEQFQSSQMWLSALKLGLSFILYKFYKGQ